MRFNGINHELCLARERRTAAGGRNVVPLLFVQSAPALPDAISTSGSLPDEMGDVMRAVNAHQPAGAKPLTADDVWLHYVEAANKSFIQKYYMFFGDSTLKNFAKDAMRGVSFMNSHRTGDMSTPSELPFGHTFGGRYEAFADGSARTTIGIYMLRGIHPNGADGPSTDDLHAQIEAGIQAEDSVGVPAGGKSICAVCENPLNARDENGQYLCSHVPGTPQNMTAEDRKRMKALGVASGYAAYWLEGAHMAEVSAVYAGAVPGAGVRKVLRLERLQQLSQHDVAAARRAYGVLLNGGDFGMDENISEALETAVARGTARGLNAAARKRDNTNNGQGPSPQQNATGNAAVDENKALRLRLEQLENTLRMERSDNRAKELVGTLRQLSKLTPTEQAPLRSFAAAVYALCEGHPDMAKMKSADGAEISLSAGMEALLGARPSMQLVGEQIPAQLGQLFAMPDASGSGEQEFVDLMDAVGSLVQDTQKKGGR